MSFLENHTAVGGPIKSGQAVEIVRSSNTERFLGNHPTTVRSLGNLKQQPPPGYRFEDALDAALGALPVRADRFAEFRVLELVNCLGCKAGSSPSYGAPDQCSCNNSTL